MGKAPLPLHGLVTRISAKWPKKKLPPRTDQVDLGDLDAFNKAQELFKRIMDTIIEKTWTDADHLPDHDKEQVRRFYNKMLAENRVREQEMVDKVMWDILIRDSEDNGGAVM